MNLEMMILNLSGLVFILVDMEKYELPLLENNYYHIYNKSNPGFEIFYNDENYRYFLRKFFFHLDNFIDLYAFCLIPNHFHMLIKVKKEFAVAKNNKSINISKAFSNFFNSYTKSIHVQNRSSGNLFQRPFKRIPIFQNNYLLNLVCYIHKNPVHHGLCKDMSNYNWSSYNEILSELKTKIRKEEILKWFGGKENFIGFHRAYLNNFSENFVFEK
jgi:REP element-mobilizing transposase RayT